MTSWSRRTRLWPPSTTMVVPVIDGTREEAHAFGDIFRRAAEAERRLGVRELEAFLGLLAAAQRETRSDADTRTFGASAIASSRVADSSAAFMIV